MDRIDAAGFYLLGTRIQPLLTIKTGMSISDAITVLAEADEWLYTLLNSSFGPKIDESRPLVEELQGTLEGLTLLPPRLAKQGLVLATGKTINQKEAEAISRLVTAFEAVFCSELPKKGIFYVSPKRAYSTDMLLESADAVLSKQDTAYLSELTLENIQEAGKCLVFDRYTAVGFHILRAVEDVARSYYELVTDRDAKSTTAKGPKYLPLGKIAAELDDQVKSRGGRDTGLLGLIVPVLAQLCRLYRNPLSHPEIVSLKEDQAIDAFTQGAGVIANMLQDTREGGPHFSVRWTAYKSLTGFICSSAI